MVKQGRSSQFLTVAQAAKESKYRLNYLRRLCREGRIEATFERGRYLINRASFEDYCRQMDRLGPAKYGTGSKGGTR